ncbi:zinc finger protein 830-like [Hydractinia symbiolongicarpus]|uniref:zinc finger protein 830-like n=1 Tax=Hydractinia symbiolongicarpus TaxID=13093 RepID=UPI00254AB14E|nr:zinc finger protein 830-like [Hydractinia symbiolongicarpus]XP_057292966.1 zinc finger protein 830-like [Hydractinia symbiolongicarpus]
MAAKSQELRKLMRQQKNTKKKIKHPLAKYNNLDQLVCIICNSVIKNEIVWNAHLQSKRHKENVSALKNKQFTPQQPISKPQPEAKSKPKPILKSILKKDRPDQCSNNKTIPNGNVPPDFFDDSVNNRTNVAHAENLQTENSQTENSINNSENNTAAPPDKDALPSDFFDEKSSSTSKSKEETDEKNNPRKRKASSTSEQLPEGFFDDPKQDAKARNVEFKDPQDEEWEKFQKMIQEETKISETIQDEEDEEAEMLKDMAELNNMKSCLSRVEKLKKLVKKSNRAKLEKNKKEILEQNEDIDGSDDSDEDLNNIFDWRAKMA